MTICVKVSDLKKMLDELIEDKVEYVDIFILEADEEEELPATLHFEAYDGYGGGCDYDYIEEVQDMDACYKINQESIDLYIADEENVGYQIPDDIVQNCSTCHFNSANNKCVAAHYGANTEHLLKSPENFPCGDYKIDFSLYMELAKEGKIK